MSGIKCTQCGMVNWSTASACKRCRAILDSSSTVSPTQPSRTFDGIISQNMMKEIIYRGGLVKFHVPSSWVEEYQPEGGGTFYEDRDDSGTLRLNILTFEANENVTSNGIPQLFKEMSLTHNSNDLRALPNGNVLLKYADRAVEEGEELLIYYWQLGNPVPPKHLRIAVFSFTILASQSSDMEIIEQIRMLDEEIAGAEFAPRLRL